MSALVGATGGVLAAVRAAAPAISAGKVCQCGALVVVELLVQSIAVSRAHVYRLAVLLPGGLFQIILHA